MRRSRWVRIAAIVFVALILVAFAMGCAPYNGDKAAFCAELRQAPSFAELSAQVEDGSDEEAAATMRRAAEGFRAMEREAPRGIRPTVARLGNSADRIAAELAPGKRHDEVIQLYQDDGTVTRIEIPADASRIDTFHRELANHQGTLTAVYEMMTYARDQCGIVDQDVDLGMVGYGGAITIPGAFDDPAGPGTPSGQGHTPGVVVDPPTTAGS